MISAEKIQGLTRKYVEEEHVFTALMYQLLVSIIENTPACSYCIHHDYLISKSAGPIIYDIILYHSR